MASTESVVPRGGPRLGECSVEVEVPFHDVDSMRIVWHGHYYKYFEQARTVLFRSCRIDVADLVAMQLALVVVDSGCRYVAPLRYGDRIRVLAWFRDVTHRLHVGYEVVNLSTGVLSARAHTVLVSTSPQGDVLYRTPDSILERVDPGAELARREGA